MSIAEEEHNSARVIKFIHRGEIGNLSYVYDVEDCEVLDSFGALDEHFVDLHAERVRVGAESNANYAIFL